MRGPLVASTVFAKSKKVVAASSANKAKALLKDILFLVFRQYMCRKGRRGRGDTGFYAVLLGVISCEWRVM